MATRIFATAMAAWFGIVTIQPLYGQPCPQHQPALALLADGRGMRSGPHTMIHGSMSVGLGHTGTDGFSNARYDVLQTPSIQNVTGAVATSETHGALSPKAGALLHLTTALGLYGNVPGGFRSSDSVVLGAYGLMHLSARVKLTQSALLDAGVRNAFTRAFPELVAGHIVAPGEPRTAYVGFRYQL